MKKVEEIGFVQSVSGRVAYVDGLPNVTVGELLEGSDKQKGYVGGLLADRVEVYLLSDLPVSPGTMFKRSGSFLELPVGDVLLGRVINCLGEPLDGLPMSAKSVDRVRIDRPATGISTRRFIEEQFDTGIAVIDTVFPLGKGQRELVIGESRSGKGDFIFDVIANQKDKGVVCVYALIGKPLVEISGIWERLAKEKLMGHVVLVISSATDPSPVIFLTSMAAFCVAESFQKRGKDVLVVLDDMGTHARSYRELSLVPVSSPLRLKPPKVGLFVVAIPWGKVRVTSPVAPETVTWLVVPVSEET